MSYIAASAGGVEETAPMPAVLPKRMSLAWLLLPIVVARSAGLVFRASDLDDCDWLIAGKMLGAGALPYVGIAEKKPVLSFLYFGLFAFPGFHLWLAQLLMMLWAFATCLVVARTARTWLPDDGRKAELVGGALACLAVVACRPAVATETLANLPSALALLYFVRGERADRKLGGSPLASYLASGVAVGVAALFKQQAGILLVPIGASLLLRARDTFPKRLGLAASVGFGFTLPWALAGAVYAAIGHFADFFAANVTANLAYGAHGAGSVVEHLALGGLLGIVLATPAQWVLALREAPAALRSGGDPVARTWLAALALTFVPVSLGGRFYDHYFIQFAPIVALCATPGALRLWDTWGERAKTERLLWTFGLSLPTLIFLGISYGGGLLGRLPMQEPRSLVVGQWVKEHTAPSDRMFVWGHFSPLYAMAERLPGTRYYNTAVHVGDFDPHHLPEGFDLAPYVSNRDVALTLSDLEEHRTEIVVDTAPADIHDWHRVPLAAVPALDRYIHAHYTLVGSPAGAAVYRRNP